MREFRGFNHINITRATGDGHERVDNIWFFQGNGLNPNEPNLPGGLEDLAAGSPYRQIVSQDSKQKIASIFRYEGRPLTTSVGGPQTVRLVEQRTSFSGDPNAQPNRIQTFDYDANGNMSETSDTDMKTANGMSLRVRMTFSNDPAVHALAYPLTVEVSDHQHSRLQYLSYGYDEVTCSAKPKEHSFLLTSLNHWVDESSTARRQLGYGPAGNLTCIQDENGGLTSFNYDSEAEYVLSKKNPLQQLTTFAYYGVNDQPALNGVPGLVQAVTTNSGHDITQYEYDYVGRVSRILAPDKSWTKIDYNNVGDASAQNVRLQTSVGLGRTLYPDGLGHIYRSLGTGPAGKNLLMTTSYDSAGLVVGINEPQLVDVPSPPPPPRVGINMKYDALGRLLTATDSTGRVNRRCYQDLQLINIDADGHARRTTSDVWGHPLSIEEFDGIFSSCEAVNQAKSYVSTAYQYDGIGRLRRVTKNGAVVSEFTYDGLGNIKRLKNIDKGEVLFQYDVAGRLRRVDQQGKRPIEYTRDLLGRLKGISTPNVCRAPDLVTFFNRLKERCGAQDLWSFGYDVGPHAEGRLSSSEGRNYAAIYEYDEHGNNTGYITSIDGRTYNLRRQYDPVGRVTRIDYPDERHVAYQYDGPVLASIADGDRSLFVARDFNAYLKPTKLQFGNGAVETFDYGLGRQSTPENQDQCASIPSGQLCRMSVSSPGNLDRSILYRYDNVLNVLAISDSMDGKRTFSYDGLERLTSELAQNSTIGSTNASEPTTYAYDVLGRRTSTSFQGPYEYGRDTQVVRPSSPTSVGATAVQSDGVGNIIRIGETRYDFDLFGQLKRVRNRNHREVEYSYDWLGNLIQRKSKYRFPYSLLKRDHSNVTYPNPYLVCIKNHCDDLVIGYGGVAAKMMTDGVDYYHIDRLGTRFAVTKSDGRLKSGLSYSAYGVLAAPNTKDAQYAGHWWDADSGLYWFNSRFYAPAIGQFLSPDADSRLISGDAGPYQYAFDNPLRWIDPDGHQGQSVTTTLGGGGGISISGGGGGIQISFPIGGGGGGGGGMGNIFPMGGGGGGLFGGGGGGGLFGGGPGPSFGGMNANSTPLSGAPGASGPGNTPGPADMFVFGSVGGRVPFTRFGGEIVVLGGYSSEGGPYVGGMILGGVKVGANSPSGALYGGWEGTLSSDGANAQPITAMEVDAYFVGGGTYQMGGQGGESGSFGYVGWPGGPEHVDVGLGMSDAMAKALGNSMLNNPALQNPLMGVPPF